MRFYLPCEGSVRIKKKFLVIPLTIGYERRWLEFVSIMQRYNEQHGVWLNTKWI